MVGQLGTSDPEVKKRKLGPASDFNTRIKLKGLCKGYRVKRADHSKMMKLLMADWRMS
jgi:hypothetical protein